MSQSINQSNTPNDHRNRHMKGRKRYFADLDFLKGECDGGWSVRGLHVEGLRAGDDEGSFECSILKPDGSRLVSLGFLISDTSEYPDDHQCFGFSQDTNVSSNLLKVVERLHEEAPRPIEEMLKKLLNRLAVADRSHEARDDTDVETDIETDDDAGFYDDESDDELGVVVKHISAVDNTDLHGDFVDTLAHGYRPGLVRLGTGDFALSVSLPIVSLARDIPVRVLMAWDKSLLSRFQHLTLLISGMRGIYPIYGKGGIKLPTAAAASASPQYKIGLTTRYKPESEHVYEILRTYGLKEDLAPPPSRIDPMLAFVEDPADTLTVSSSTPEADKTPKMEDGFRLFSLSSSLETLLNNYFAKVVHLRLKYDLGWAGAETLCWEAELLQQTPEAIFKSMRKKISAAEEEEIQLSQTYNLPPDPLLYHGDKESLNLPLVAFCYLLRRLTLCTRYCSVCHNRLKSEYEVLKPTVCASTLCAYQFYNHNRGASLEASSAYLPFRTIYEICTNPETVDLLVNFAYIAAAEHALEDPLPVGLGLKFPTKYLTMCAPNPAARVNADELCDFDQLALHEMRTAIVSLLNQLPSVADMKAYLEQKVKPGKAKPKLRDIDSFIPEASWVILRWCISSCTAHLEELTSEEDLVQNIGKPYSSWRQFRFSVGAPDAEAKFRAAVISAQQQDANTVLYPSLFAFHGSSAKNWHSIIHHGLWYKIVTNGRAYGDGVYFAKDGMVSSSAYAIPAVSKWKNGNITIGRCMALAEIVNLPSSFTSSDPYFVVPHTEWIVCRYLLVQTYPLTGNAMSRPKEQQHADPLDIPFVALDPKHPLTVSKQAIRIPEPSYKIDKLLSERLGEQFEEENDADDEVIISGAGGAVRTHSGATNPGASGDGSEGGGDDTMRIDDWEHDPEWVNACVQHLMPAPADASPMATMAVQRELKAMLREQKEAKSLRELGWYMSQDRIGDNLFQWIVELHSFEPELPVAQDMRQRGVNSVVFEIRFPPTFPHSPPFFRILKPRFLPFIHGGGGHVTGGGSICMDLLTADGWLPSYRQVVPDYLPISLANATHSISAVLLQIKLAISNLDPRPARLAANWDTPYQIGEALEGYRRAASTHGWKVPEGLDHLARY
ncbi:hypothetical protein CERSUDRAFT_156784 [Gelatoporia subvermispora B]|uniref:UBC core domain-containing protein n=1 Tax=Ceriporiopsis subvermispora (strain B) TaxID=914234 RepID=M2PIQ0_CERS8|nr:hypothetical protein CERSUDRAFT_156784 [Gelatoporia subvermispora B]